MRSHSSLPSHHNIPNSLSSHYLSLGFGQVGTSLLHRMDLAHHDVEALDLICLSGLFVLILGLIIVIITVGIASPTSACLFTA